MTEITFAPKDGGVYVKVSVEVVVSVTVEGVNVPPAPLSLGVTTTDPATDPFEPTVKFVEAFPNAPEVGPERVIAVAGAGGASSVTLRVFELTVDAVASV